MQRAHVPFTLCTMLCISAVATAQQLYHAIELQTLPGGSMQAYALSNRGAVTGESGSHSSLNAFIHTSNGIANLNTLGFQNSLGLVVNDNGVVGGVGYFAGGVGTPFRYTPDEGTSFVSCLGGTSGSVTGVNARGELAGYWDRAGGGIYSFFAGTDGAVTDIGTLGGMWTVATGMNDARQIVGYSFTSGPPSRMRAFIWTPNEGIRSLGTLGGESSQASAINAAGMVVGSSESPRASSVPFIWTANEGMIEIPLPGGSGFGEATLVNDAGVVAGRYLTPECEQRGYIYSAAGGFEDFGGLEGDEPPLFISLRSMNKRGVVVGQYLPPTCIPSAFVWTRAHGMRDLNELVEAQLGWHATNAMSVNDTGQILVTGYLGSYYKSALLTPKWRAAPPTVTPKTAGVTPKTPVKTAP